jgi:hypothetical protein
MSRPARTRFPIPSDDVRWVAGASPCQYISWPPLTLIVAPVM